MATSRDRYYKEIFKTLTEYNDRKNTPSSNEKIREAIYKVVEYESISDFNNLTADTFSHASNTQRENSNAIFTSEKLDNPNELLDTENKLTINDSKYH